MTYTEAHEGGAADHHVVAVPVPAVARRRRSPLEIREALLGAVEAIDLES